MRWKTHDPRVAVSRRSYGGRNGEPTHLALRLHKVGAVSRPREGKSREPLLRNKVDRVRHDGRQTERGGRTRQFGMGETDGTVCNNAPCKTELRLLLIVTSVQISSFSRSSCRIAPLGEQGAKCDTTHCNSNCYSDFRSLQVIIESIFLTALPSRQQSCSSFQWERNCSTWLAGRGGSTCRFFSLTGMLRFYTYGRPSD